VCGMVPSPRGEWNLSWNAAGLVPSDYIIDPYVRYQVFRSQGQEVVVEEEDAIDGTCLTFIGLVVLCVDK